MLKKKIIIVLLAALTSSTWVHAQSMDLDTAIEMAINNNLTIKIAQKDKDKAVIALKGSKAILDPTVTVSSSAGISETDDKGSTRNNKNSVALSMPIYSAGKNELNISKAEDNIQIMDLTLYRTKQDIKLDTTNAYYDVLEAQKIVKVDQESVSNYQEHLKNVQNLYGAGAIAKADLLRSEVELVNAEQTLIKDQNTYEVSLVKLKNIIRYKSKEELQLVDIATIDDEYKDLTPCQTIAKEKRPEVAKLKLAIIQAERDIKIAKADKKPTVSLSLGTNWDKAVLPSTDNNSWSATVSANWNVFDSNVTSSKVEQAEIDLEQSKLELDKQIDDIDTEVTQAYLNLKEAKKRFDTTGVAVKKAQEDFYIAKEKYKVGEGILLDVIDAQLALSTAQQNNIQAQYDYVKYKAQLENAMGDEVNHR